MSDRFAVEADRKVVGVAVRTPGGFRFFSSDPDFFVLEGRLFPRRRAVFQSAAEIAANRRRDGAGVRR